MKLFFAKFKKVIPLTLVLIFIFLQVIILNYDSTSGKEYELITVSIDQLETENILLETKIASNSSILAISNKADSLGFISNKSVISLYGPQPLAALQSTL